MNEKDLELETLHSEGISLWSKSQEFLEGQALQEFEVLAKQHRDANCNQQISESEAKVNVILSSQNSAQSCVTKNEKEDLEESSEAESEYVPSEGELSDEDYKPLPLNCIEKGRKIVKQKKGVNKKNTRNTKSKIEDDALESNYKARLKVYYDNLEQEFANNDVSDEINSYKKLKGGLKIPLELWDKLYDYQRESIKWLWEISQKPTGGLLGDEMGLGKTVQVVAFLHSLQYSKIVSRHCNFIGVGPTLIVSPATVIYEWLNHFHKWAPEFRIAILHQSGTHKGNKNKLINDINKDKGIIILTYAAVLKYQKILSQYNWHFFILDEGHKIRNPSAKISVAIKGIKTPHRIMLTGSPMQNNLTELWSLFDFTNPGMLGTLATFTEHFINPILQGGFANSTPMQEATALSVASILKDIISPFLLRRMKKDVQTDIHLPHKSEQVLFCSLTDEQREMYKNYLLSEKVQTVLDKQMHRWGNDKSMKANILIAISALRKICNHPDLFVGDQTEEYGHHKKSGKMVVVAALLKIWKKQNHKTLLFCQGRLMLKMFERFLAEQGYTFLKMDGSTSVSSRQGLIDKFNQDSSYDVFLLTTRVGGLGINLTAANRVIIYDPDWNPATDMQARERAWRIGQKKSVTVYRLISAGTVEEKMYQRQVWKQLLSNKILEDPSTNKLFKSSDLFDLFSLPDARQLQSETANIFRDARVKLENNKKNEPYDKNDSEKKTVQFSDTKVQEMKALAQKIAKNMSRKLNYDENPSASQAKLAKTNSCRENDQKTNIKDNVSKPCIETGLTDDSSKLKIKKGKKRKHKDSFVDTSGKLDGEYVEGLVKREKEETKNLHKTNEDDTLAHLMSKKGVFSILEHESVLKGQQKQNLRARNDAAEVALRSLNALKKSRLNNWRW